MTVSGAPVQTTGVCLGRLAELSLERTGGAAELYFCDEHWTAAQLAGRARRLSGGLRAAGLRPGDRVVVCMANCPEVGVAYQAIWRAGAVVTPVLFLLREPELRHVLADSGAAFVLTSPEFLDKVTSAARGVPTVRGIVLAGQVPAAPAPAPATAATPDAGGPPRLDFAELERAPEGSLVDADPAGMAALLYTGGTTGRAKGVVLSHDGLSAAAWAAKLSRGDDRQVGLLPLPLSHAYGLMVSVLGLHATEPGAGVLMRWFDPAEFLRLVAEYRVQNTAVVPTMVQMLLGQPLEEHDTSSLCRVTSGGAPLLRETAEEWRRRLPHVELVEGYGCTETSAVVSTSPAGGVRLGSVGRPAPGVEIRIERPDGTPAAAGQDGEICVRGPMVMSGYWHAEEETARALRDGWLHTGDIGHLDADGYLYVVDRIKDLIIRDGFNVYPRDVEDTLLVHPDVTACGVVGRPDPRRGEDVVAFVQLRPGATVTVDDLVGYARSRLSAAKYPREVRIVDQVPLTSMLKTDRKALRALLRA
jgi:long-chain acyl-CoA synthetase